MGALGDGLRRFTSYRRCPGALAALLSLAAFQIPAQSQTSAQMQIVEHQRLIHWGYSLVSINPDWKPVTSSQATQLEQRLNSNPEDAEARTELLTYYWHNDMRQQRVDSVCWLIEHHPDSPILSLDLAWIFPNAQSVQWRYQMALNDATDFERVLRLWQVAIAQNPENPEALHNAARFLESSDPARSAELVKRMQQLDPQGHTTVAAGFYNQLLTGNFGVVNAEYRALQQQVFQELIDSDNSQLLWAIGSVVIKNPFNATPENLPKLCEIGLQLIQPAHTLEPQNQQWPELLSAANAAGCAAAQ
jgi:tetratricopeptide (TPR) repeat protein